MTEPLVSIIIPLYNAEKYIGEAIASAVNQTWPNKEIIIVDDGSTDSSLAIAKKHENSWIKIFSEENKGASAARNKGLQEAKGAYIQFLDADDLLSSNKIEQQVKLLQAHPGKIAVCPTVHFYDGNEHTEQHPSTHEYAFLIETNGFDFLINLWGGATGKGSMVQPNAWLTPRTVIDKAGLWNETLTVDDDGEFFCRVILNSGGIVVAQNTCCYYRKYRQGLSLSAGKDSKAIESIFNSILLKSGHLKKIKEDSRIDKVIAASLTGLLMTTYPQHKKLAADIMKHIKQTDIAIKPPPLGGPLLETIKKIFGWKTARWIQYYYAKF